MPCTISIPSARPALESLHAWQGVPDRLTVFEASHLQPSLRKYRDTVSFNLFEVSGSLSPVLESVHERREER
jgi:hypothetical protein